MLFRLLKHGNDLRVNDSSAWVNSVRYYDKISVETPFFQSGVAKNFALALRHIFCENVIESRFKFLVASSMFNLNMKGGISYEKPCQNKRNILPGHSFTV